MSAFRPAAVPAALFLGLTGCPKSTSTAPWPEPTPYVDLAKPWTGEALPIDRELPLRFDGTAAVYHPTLRAVLLGAADGQLGHLDPEGYHDPWSGPQNLSALCLKDPTSPLVYAAIASPDALVALDWSTQSVLRRWTLTTWLDSSDLSGITWVPDSHHPWGQTRSGGVFYAATTDGTITVFDIDIGEAEAVERLGDLTPVPGRTGLSDLHYDTTTRTLYAAYGSAQRIVEAWTNGALRREWTIRPRDVRGLATIPTCSTDSTTLVLLESEGATWRLPGLPASCTP